MYTLHEMICLVAAEFVGYAITVLLYQVRYAVYDTQYVCLNLSHGIPNDSQQEAMYSTVLIGSVALLADQETGPTVIAL